MFKESIHRSVECMTSWAWTLKIPDLEGCRLFIGLVVHISYTHQLVAQVEGIAWINSMLTRDMLSIVHISIATNIALIFR